ncbi:hypothetical protein KGG73_gp60 [Streptomyces phage Sentinel]|uniref:Uncharacterized protein n=1 Tax=Streptomyces phage Sentinel TaxID=2767584 RepID=A0A873WVW9_9CAUD|nr:hypothetical protein KGG73_gp60 [Streptomyces phage Sentinel]QPB09894.1 hypothetical protein CPT_Sentinel_060 [Streptomyces phage Sentinel]
MKIEREVREIETEAGKFYIMVLAAQRKTYSHWDRDADRTIPSEDLIPRVWLATDPQLDGKAELGAIKIRGRKYTIDHQLARLPKGRGYLTEGRFEFNWSSESSYGGPYRNEQRKTLEFRTKTYDVLYDLEREALDKFAKDYPEWETESIRLLFERERDNHAAKSRQLLVEADQHDIKAAQWQKRIDDLAA